MSATKHTPGPWHWDADPIKGDPLGRIRYRVVALGKTVTQCYYSSSDECAEHDARLIAAAPKLLAACQKFMDGISILNDGPDDSDVAHAQKLLVESFTLARDAIKAANPIPSQET